LETKINVISASEHELEATLTYEEIQPEIEQAYKEEGKKIEMPGFRKGKVPITLLKKTYGEAIEYKASEKIANKKFWEIVETQNLNPISTPKMVDLDFERGTKISFKIQYEVMPELDLKDYTGNEISKIELKVNDELVEEEITSLRKRNSKDEDTEIVEDKLNVINVNLQKLDEDGNLVDEKGQDLNIDLSDSRVNKEIVDNAIGKKKGETFKFSFKDIRDVEEDGNKKVVEEVFNYQASINSIKKIVLPEFDDDFVKKISKDKFSNITDWRENIQKGIQSYYDLQSEDMYINGLLSTIVKNNDFEPPHGYVHKILDNLVAMEEDKAKREGHKHFDAHQVEKQLHNRAEWNAKWQIIVNNLSKKENIEVTEEELKEAAEKEAAETGISVEKLIKFYKDSGRKDTLLEQKVIDFLKNNNTVKIINPNEQQQTEKE